MLCASEVDRGKCKNGWHSPAQKTPFEGTGKMAHATQPRRTGQNPPADGLKSNVTIFLQPTDMQRCMHLSAIAQRTRWEKKPKLAWATIHQPRHQCSPNSAMSLTCAHTSANAGWFEGRACQLLEVLWQNRPNSGHCLPGFMRHCADAGSLCVTRTDCHVLHHACVPRHACS